MLARISQDMLAMCIQEVDLSGLLGARSQMHRRVTKLAARAERSWRLLSLHGIHKGGGSVIAIREIDGARREEKRLARLEDPGGAVVL